jgi:phospholipase/carboxylesterase/glyoxalase family protein
MAELGYTHLWTPGAGPRTLLLLHGTGGDEHDLVPLAGLLDPTANVLSPRGNVPEHGALRFFRRLAEGVFDLDDLHRRTDALADFVGNAAAAYGFDETRVTAAGFSNGANIAAAMLLQRPTVLAEAVLFRAMIPFEPAAPPALHGRRIFLSAGRTDTMIPAAQTEQLAQMFESYGADVSLQWSPGGHGLARGDVDAARAWIDAR